MEMTSWPIVNPINQKNYYTEYLKRDDQILAFRLQQEEARNRMTKQAKDRDRAPSVSVGTAEGSVTDHTFTIEFQDSGVQAFSFTDEAHKGEMCPAKMLSAAMRAALNRLDR